MSYFELYQQATVMHVCTSTLLACCMFFVSDALADDEPIVLDPAAPRNIRAEVDLFGFRRFPETLFDFQKGALKGLPSELIYAAAEKTDGLSHRLRQAGKSLDDLETADLVNLIKTLPKTDLQSESRLIMSENYSIDAEFVLRMLDSELVESDPRVFNGFLTEKNQPVEMVSVVPKVQRHFSETYAVLEIMKFYDADERVKGFEDIRFQLAQYPVLLEAAKATFAVISMGEVFSFPASEKELKIEPSVERRYDIYWVEFPLNLRSVEKEGISELRFHVTLPEDSIALELVPRRFGVEMVISERLSSPDVTVEVQGVSVSVGEYYGKTVQYTLLKPTIVATGLRLNKFSWFLTDEALDTGSYLFVGILGVPKGTERIAIGYSVDADVESFWGLQGDLTGTGVVFDMVELRSP